MRLDPAAFIRANLQLGPVAGIKGVQLYQAHPGSGLSRVGRDEPPYWAYAWGGGLMLSQFLRVHPHLVAGRNVLDLGAGSGLVGIVAAQAGANVQAAEVDPFGQAAIRLNAEANEAAVTLSDVDTDGAVPTNMDIVLAGDVFYLPEVAARMLPFLRRCADAGMGVLIGDPQRRDLPREHLTVLAQGLVRDMGGVERRAGVYAFETLCLTPLWFEGKNTELRGMLQPGASPQCHPRARRGSILRLEDGPSLRRGDIAFGTGFDACRYPAYITAPTCQGTNSLSP